MPIDIQCGECFHAFRVSSRYAGKKGKCPACGETVRVPADASRSSSSESYGAPPPVQSSRSGSSRKRASGSRKSNSGSNPNALLIGMGGGIVLLLGVIVFLLTRSPSSSVGNPAGVAQNAPEPARSDGDDSPPIPQTHRATSSPKARRSAKTVTAAPSPQSPSMPVETGGQLVKASTAEQPVSPAANEETILAPVAESLTATQLVERVEPSVVRINAISEDGELEWHGSGFIIDAAGVVATNHHVVAGAHQCVVVFTSGKTFDVQGYYVMDESRDIAILQVELPEGEYKALPLATSLPPKGEQVLAFGCPYGLDFSATDGLISAARSSGEMKSMLGADVNGEWLQTSAPISPGNSGGPLVNMRGEVVGINSLVRSEGQNLNFAISALDVQSISEKRGDKITELSRGTEAKDAGIKLSGSRAGEQFLSKVDSVFLVVRYTGDEAEEKLGEIVETFAKKHLRGADIGVTGVRSIRSPLMLITVEAHDGVEEGTADVAVAAQLLYPVEVDGEVQILIVWETRGEVGSPKKFKLRRNPKQELQDGLAKFFSGMENEIKSAKRRADN